MTSNTQTTNESKTMTITSTSGKKAVHVRKDATGKFGAFYVQFDGMGGEQVLECKWYKTEKAAIKWAKSQIS